MSQPSMDIGSIAIVEDDPVVRRLMRLWLEADGYSVIEYSCGREAALHDTSKTALVCLDLRLEDVPGQSVLAELRARDPDLPIIVVTGDEDAETAALAMRAGAYDFVTKPFDQERLGQAVRRAVERRQLSASVERLRRELGERTVQPSSNGADTMSGYEGESIELSHLTSAVHGAPPSDIPPPGDIDHAGLGDAGVFDGSTLNLREIERAAITRALKLAGGSVGKAAKLLGIGRATLYRRLSEQRAPMGGEPSNKINGHEAARP